jgi:hypothetical protein
MFFRVSLTRATRRHIPGDDIIHRLHNVHRLQYNFGCEEKLIFNFRVISFFNFILFLRGGHNFETIYFWSVTVIYFMMITSHIKTS